MTTDNDPVDYLYISERQTTNIVRQHEAARPRRRTRLDIKGGPLAVGIRWLSPDYLNQFDLARRATEAVESNTGDLEYPGIYVRGQLDIQTCKVRVGYGFDRMNTAVVGFFSDQEIKGIGRVFVGLFGSVANFASWKRKPKFDTEQHPSDAAGLYEILSTNREPSDPNFDSQELEDDRQLSTLDRFEAAHGIAPVRPLEFLAKVHEHERALQISSGPLYDAALLGGPVWVATPTPVALKC
jgi:hypothetical protein